MRKECPECRGQRTVFYARWPEPEPVVEFAASTTSAEMTVSKTLENCRRCRGDGTIENTDPIPVFQYGVKIGTVPPDFDPDSFVSRSVMYRPRRGDFQLIGSHFDASPSLGDGDLEAVPGFVWERK